MGNLPSYSANALKATRIPLLASFSAVACNITANLLLYQRLGAPGLALGTSIGALVNITILYTSFVRRWGSLDGHGLLRHLIRVVTASLIMGLCCHYVAALLEARFGSQSVRADLLVTLLPVLLGILLYAALARMLRLEEMVFGWRRLRRS